MKRYESRGSIVQCILVSCIQTIPSLQMSFFFTLNLHVHVLQRKHTLKLGNKFLTLPREMLC